ncbi:MAG: ArsR family transcriptional regulator [Candidatus Omnitrophota bacterium]|jgi:predicted nucleotidyltransferase|nr:MAG: ArsR family transcriptional regulator [Candidatus Omnitrophota bacterium]
MDIMLKKLLGSRIRINILKLFIFNPKKEYYVREIERLINEAFDPVRRELIRLESTGLLKSRISGRQKYYSIDSAHTLFPEVKSMILKTVGIGDTIKNALEDRNDVKIAFIYGSYAKNSEDLESDIDIFVIGDISSKDLQEDISGIENQVKREINPTIYSISELKDKYRSKNHFISSVFKEPKIFLKGDENGLRKLVSGR